MELISIDVWSYHRFNDSYRDLSAFILSQYLFESIAEVQHHATQWLWTYNNERPSNVIGEILARQKLALVA